MAEPGVPDGGQFEVPFAEPGIPHGGQSEVPSAGPGVPFDFAWNVFVEAMALEARGE